jgi:hypothetical protein
MAAVFLDKDDIVALTNRKAKGKQIDILRRMGIPFFVNSTGHPVVTRSAVEGKPEAEQPVKRAWVPKVLQKK